MWLPLCYKMPDSPIYDPGGCHGEDCCGGRSSFTDVYYYRGAIVWKVGEHWYADVYPHRQPHEPDTIIGPFNTVEEVKEAIEKAP